MGVGTAALTPRTGAWTALAITLAIQAMVSMAVLCVPSMAPAMARHLGVSASLVGLFVSCVYVGAMLSSMAGGSLVLRWGAIRVSQVGLLLCAGGLVMLALTPWAPLALCAGVLIGLGYGPITPASSHVLVRTAPPARMSLVFSIKQTGVPLGGVLAGALVPSIVVGAGVGAALWAVALACIACAVMAQRVRPTLDLDRKPGHRVNLAGLWQPVKLVASNDRLRRLAAVSFVFSALQMSLAAYLVTYLNTEVGLMLVAAGVALSVSQVGGVLGRILWGWLADHWITPLRMLAVLAVLMASCSIATALLQGGALVPVMWALLFLFGASATGWNGVYLSEVARQAPPGSAGVATGGALAFTFLGVVVGPVLFGMASEAGGSLRLGYVLMALPVLACAVVLARSASLPPPGAASGGQTTLT